MLLSEQRQSDTQSKQLSVKNSFVDEERGDQDRMKLDPATRDQVLAIVPNLRAFAISLSGSIDRADDLVQETLLRAISHIDSFKRGTNMPAWLTTILRNLFFEEVRKRQREVQDADGRYAETLVSYPEQTGQIELGELRAALAKLPVEQCEALLLVGASDFSYDDAAVICGCATGTIRSRVHRARTRLADLLAIDRADKLGPDRATLGVLAAGEQLVQRKFA
jgi:RNA polymerase sigma-70 factor (ECF subfamily)